MFIEIIKNKSNVINITSTLQSNFVFFFLFIFLIITLNEEKKLHHLVDIDIAADYKIEREWTDLEFEGKSNIVDIRHIQTNERIA